MPYIPQVAPQGPVGGGYSADVPGGNILAGSGQQSTQGLSQGLSRAATAAMRTAMRVQNERDDAQVKSGLLDLTSFKTDLLRGSDGFLNLRGDEANGDRRTAVLEAFDAKVQTVSDSLDNDVQRQMFSLNARAFRNSLRETVLIHEAAEVRSHNIGVTEELRRQTILDARDAWIAGNPKAALSVGGVESGPDIPRQTGAELNAQMELEEFDLTLAGSERLPAVSAEFAQQDARQAAELAEATRVSSYEYTFNSAVELAHQLAEYKGWDEKDPRHQALVEQTQTEIVTLTLDALLKEERDSEAKEYFESSRKYLDQATQNTLRQGFAVRDDKKSGIQLADNLVSKLDRKIQQQTDRPSALFGASWLVSAQEQIEGQEDLSGVQVEAAMQRLSVIQKRREALFNEEKVNLTRQAIDLLRENPTAHPNGEGFTESFLQSLKSYDLLPVVEEMADKRNQLGDVDSVYYKALDLTPQQLRDLSEEQLHANYGVALSEKRWGEIRSLWRAANNKATLDDIMFVEAKDVVASVSEQLGYERGSEDDISFRLQASELATAFRDARKNQVTTKADITKFLSDTYRRSSYGGRYQMTGVDPTTGKLLEGRLVSDILTLEKGSSTSPTTEYMFAVDDPERFLEYRDNVYIELVRPDGTVKRSYMTDIPLAKQGEYTGQLFQMGYAATPENIFEMWIHDGAPSTSLTESEEAKQRNLRRLMEADKQLPSRGIWEAYGGSSVSGRETRVRTTPMERATRGGIVK